MHYITDFNYRITWYFSHGIPVSFSAQDGQCLLNEQLFNILFASCSLHFPRPCLLQSIKFCSEEGILNFWMGFALIFLP